MPIAPCTSIVLTRMPNYFRKIVPSFRGETQREVGTGRRHLSAHPLLFATCCRARSPVQP